MASPETTQSAENEGTDFVSAAIDADNASGRFGGRVVTRFPPEPNGHLHLGHAKAIWLNFSIAEKYGGRCHLRFDDTNPSKESDEFVQGQQRDIRWLGFDWGEHLHFASDYFEQLYAWAQQLVREGHAYVCDLSGEEMREYRGTITEPGRDSPWRDRPADESLDLLERMRQGEFPDGARTLRARIDMASPNLNLRDPVMYRIQHTAHHRTGTTWKIYPTYDWAHGQSDSIEGITHSICTLEFEVHRPLYDWFLDRLGIHHPQQIEFAKLRVEGLRTGKRLLSAQVAEGAVDGWDDPRMPTIAGLRRRGFTPEAIRRFMEMTRATKSEATHEFAMLEYCVREDLNKRSPRVMAVLDPLKVVITNYPEDQVEEFEAVNNPEDASAGTRRVPFARELWVERDDFREDPPRKFFRLSPGREVRLRAAYLITCEEVIKDDDGNVIELRCRYDPATRGGDAPDGRKVKATLHWVAARAAVEGEVRIHDRLFLDEERDGEPVPNPDSLRVLSPVWLEPSLAEAAPGARFQFERLGYFCADERDHRRERPVFNRTVTLRDGWARAQRNA